jgi:hypothetical protein
MWKAVLAGMLLCAAATLAATLTLRDGRKVTGTVVCMDDTNIVLQTPAGQQTYPWRSVSNESIQQTNPALYERLLARAQERQRQAQAPTQTVERFVVRPRDGTVAAGGQLLAGVRLGVSKATRQGDHIQSTMERRKQARKNGWSGVQAQNHYGELTVRLDGLNATRSYNVRAEATLYMRMTTAGSIQGGTMRVNRRFKGDDTQTVSNAPTARLTFCTAPYTERKLTSSEGSATTKGKVRYWDIRVWIDGALVYEEKDDKSPVFYHVTKK